MTLSKKTVNLNFFFASDEVWLHGTVSVWYPCLATAPVTMRIRNSSLFCLNHINKYQLTVHRLIFCSFVSTICSILRDNFMKTWRWNLWKMEREWRLSELFILCYLLFNLTHRVSHSLNTSPALFFIVWTFLDPLLKIGTPLPTTKSFVASSL